MSGDFQALAILGSGEQTAPDVQHVFSAVEMAVSGGEEVALDSIWTAHETAWVFEGGSPPFKTGILDEEKTFELADIDLMRFDLADEYLNARERLIRQAVRSLTGQGSAEIARQAIAITFRKLGGAAILEGTLQGVSVAAGYYDDLRLVGR